MFGCIKQSPTKINGGDVTMRSEHEATDLGRSVRREHAHSSPRGTPAMLQSVTHLDARFRKADLLCQSLPRKDVWVVGALKLCKQQEEGSLQ